MVAKAKADALVILTGYEAEGLKEKNVRLAAAAAGAKHTQEIVETDKIRMNNEATGAQAEAIKTLRAGRTSKYNNLPEPSAFENLLPKEQPKKDPLKKY